MHRDKGKKCSCCKISFFLFFPVDDRVSTVKSDPKDVLRTANLLHPNLQITIETPNTSAFLDLQISIDKNRKINCGLYQKPTDTGTILNFRTCAPLRKREM